MKTLNYTPVCIKKAWFAGVISRVLIGVILFQMMIPFFVNANSSDVIMESTCQPAEISANEASQVGLGTGLPMLLGVLTAVSFLTPKQIESAPISWSGNGENNYWSNPDNWTGRVVPGPNDIAIFANAQTQSCVIDANASVSGLWLENTWTNTVTQSPGVTLSIGSTGYSQAGGSFNGGTAPISLSGPFTLSGGSFTSTSGTLNFLTNGYTYEVTGGTFAHNNGTILVSGNYTNAYFKMGSAILNHCTFDHVGTVTLTRRLNVEGVLTLKKVNTTFSGDTLASQGNVQSLAHGEIWGSATLFLNGSGSQTISGNGNMGALLSKVVIDKPVSAALALQDTLRTTRGWYYKGGAVDAGNSTVMFSGGGLDPVIQSKGMAFKNLLFYLDYGTVTLVNTNDVQGDLILKSNDMAFAGDTLQAFGNVKSLTRKSIWGTGTLLFTGGNTQTVSANGNLGPILPTIVVSKSAGTLRFQDTLSSSSKAWYYVSGDVDTTSGTILFAGGGKDPTVRSNGMKFNNVIFGLDYGTVNLVGKNTVRGILTFKSNDMSFGGDTLCATGNVRTLTRKSIWGNGTLLFAGNGEQVVDASGFTGPILPKVVIEKDGGFLKFQDTLKSSSKLWRYVSGTVDTMSGTILLSGSCNDPVINSQGMKFNNLIFNIDVGTVTLIRNNTVRGNLVFQSNDMAFTGDTLSATGNVQTLTRKSIWTSGKAASLMLTGPWNQTISANGHVGPLLPVIIIDKAGGTLTLQDTLQVSSSWYHVSGMVNSGLSTVTISGGGTPTISSAGMKFNNLLIQNGYSGLTLLDSLNVINDFSISNPITVNATGTVKSIHVGGNLTSMKGVWSNSTAHIVLDGTGTQIIHATCDGTDSPVPNGQDLIINKSSGKVVLGANLSLDRTGLEIRSGILDQGDSYNLWVKGALVINSSGVLMNKGTGDLTLGNILTNNGLLVLNSGGASCGEERDILIRSTTSGTQRTWSGTGRFFIMDADVKDMTSTVALIAYNCTNSGNNSGSWDIREACASAETDYRIYVQEGYTGTSPDGSLSNPYPLIQTALQNIPADYVIRPYAICLLPPISGDYYTQGIDASLVNYNFTSENPLRICPQDMLHRVKIKKAGTIFDLKSLNNVTIEGLIFEGDGTYPGFAIMGSHRAVGGSDNVTVRKCKFINTATTRMTGIFAMGDSLKVENCIFYSENENDLMTFSCISDGSYGAKYYTIVNNTVLGNRSDGIPRGGWGYFLIMSTFQGTVALNNVIQGNSFWRAFASNWAENPILMRLNECNYIYNTFDANQSVDPMLDANGKITSTSCPLVDAGSQNVLTLNDDYEGKYDALGKRDIGAYEFDGFEYSSGTFYSINASGSSIAELDKNGMVVSSNIFGAGMVGKEVYQDKHLAERLYYLTNHQGSTMMVLNEALTSASVQEYYSSGEQTSGTRGANGSIELGESYVGQRLIDDGKAQGLGINSDGIGLYSMGARFYDPLIGRFISQDPMGQYGDLYSYCGGDPVNLSDPGGLYARDDVYGRDVKEMQEQQARYSKLLAVWESIRNEEVERLRSQRNLRALKASERAASAAYHNKNAELFSTMYHMGLEDTPDNRAKAYGTMADIEALGASNIKSIEDVIQIYGSPDGLALANQRQEPEATSTVSIGSDGSESGVTNAQQGSATGEMYASRDNAWSGVEFNSSSSETGEVQPVDVGSAIVTQARGWVDKAAYNNLCSDWVEAVYKDAGFSLGSHDYANAFETKPMLTPVNGTPMPGDIPQWDRGTAHLPNGHVAIYVGDGRMVSTRGYNTDGTAKTIIEVDIMRYGLGAPTRYLRYGQ